MAQHLKQLHISRLRVQELKKKGKQSQNSFPSLIPAWIIPKIDRDSERPANEDRPVVEIDQPPNDTPEIVWPPPQKKEDEDKDRGVAIIPILKKR